jgi:OOP family OmpA-OmpF porin
MKLTLKPVFMFLLAMLIMAPAFSHAADMEYIPKIASFDFFVDDSGSMMMTHQKLDKPKIEVAKDVLSKINNAIPALKYNASMHMFAPYEEVVPYGPYSKSGFEQGIMSLKADKEIFARRTPMGDGLNMLRPAADNMARNAAVIIVSDGESNFGSDPVAQAQALYESAPGLCLHVVSVAETEAGKAVLDRIAALKGCSVTADAATLLADEQALNGFVKDVFYDTREVKKAPVPAPVVTPETEEVIVLRSVQFAFDSAEISNEAEDVLTEAATLIEEHAGKQVTLAGHTDSTGPEAYNQKLSQRRAESVKAFLAKEGVDANRIKAVGFGESEPKFDNNTAEGRKLNRRVEITFK